MPGILRRPDYYREEARQLRAIAESVASSEHRAELVKIAAQYETLAEKVEAALKSFRRMDETLRDALEHGARKEP